MQNAETDSNKVIIASLLLIWLGGCSAPKPELRIGLAVWPPYELAMLAEEKGWLENTNVRLFEYQSPAEMTRAFRNELLDAMFVTSQISVRLAAGGIDHRIIYVIDFSRGGDALVAKESIAGLAGLRGKSIGVGPSALGAYVFHRVLDSAGLDPSEVNVIPLDVAEQVSRWQRGPIDAVICYEPVRTQLLERGGHVLFDSRDIPDEIVDVLIAHTRVVDERGDTLQVFIRSLVRALEFYRDSPGKAVNIMAPRTSLAPREFQLALNGTHLLKPEENRLLLQEKQLQMSLEKQIEVMLRAGLLQQDIDAGELIDGRFVCSECLK